MTNDMDVKVAIQRGDAGADCMTAFGHTIREIGARLADFTLEFLNMAERSFGE
jgi:hypothetical protein